MAPWWQRIQRAFGSGPQSEPEKNPDTEAPAIIDTLDGAGSFLAAVTGKPMRCFSTRDFGRDEFTEARSVLVQASQAEPMLGKIRSRLGPGLVAFIGTQTSHARPRPSGVELLVGRGASQFDILRIAASDAVNYGKETEDLVKQLQVWDSAYGVDIFQAETDTIQFRLKIIPADLKKFADEVYEFCPDIVDQGVESVDQLAKDIGESRKVLLWWD